jgi:hypothetical protein
LSLNGIDERGRHQFCVKYCFHIEHCSTLDLIARFYRFCFFARADQHSAGALGLAAKGFSLHETSTVCGAHKQIKQQFRNSAKTFFVRLANVFSQFSDIVSVLRAAARERHWAEF